MTVLQLFPALASLFNGNDLAEPYGHEAANSLPPHVRPVMDGVDGAAPELNSYSQTVERLEEAKSILLDIVRNHEVQPPLFPRSAREAYRLSLSTQATAADLMRVLERDPGLSMRLLRQANESFASPVSPCRSVHEAIHRVGLRTVRHLLMRATSERLLAIPDDQSMTSLLQGRAYAVARCARRIARRAGADTNVAFTAGLLHGVGWTLAYDLLRNYPTHFPDWIQNERASTWKEIAAYSHQELGATLARRWSLPSPVVAAIEFHHEPQKAQEPEAEMAYIVAVANDLCDHLELYSETSRPKAGEWRSAWAIGVDPDTICEESVGLERSIRESETDLSSGACLPRLGKGRVGRGRGALDDGLEQLR